MREKERERIEREITITLDHSARRGHGRMPIRNNGRWCIHLPFFHFVSLTVTHCQGSFNDIVLPRRGAASRCNRNFFFRRRREIARPSMIGCAISNTREIAAIATTSSGGYVCRYAFSNLSIASTDNAPSHIRLEVYYKWDEDPVCATLENVQCIDCSCCFELNFQQRDDDSKEMLCILKLNNSRDMRSVNKKNRYNYSKNYQIKL